MGTVIIGIAGGTASGKTTIAKKVYETTSKQGTVSLIKIDDYYKILDHLTFEERTKVNYDHPDAYDIELLTKHLCELKEGKTIKKPVYDFVVHNRSKEITETIEPSNIIIVEGILVLEDKKIICRLTQAESLSFTPNSRVRVQLRARLKDGTTIASRIRDVTVGNVLKEGII